MQSLVEERGEHILVYTEQVQRRLCPHLHVKQSAMLDLA
jgi:hypothetical protein